MWNIKIWSIIEILNIVEINNIFYHEHIQGQA